MEPLYPASKVEVHGLAARHYDALLDVLTLGGYGRVLRRAIAMMGIENGEHVLDLGAGTGRNACLMRAYAGASGTITALEIGHEMRAQFRRRCGAFSNVILDERRIDLELPYRAQFDKALLSFVIHGFPHAVRIRILDNVRHALRPGGDLFIFDFAEFSLATIPWYVRIPFTTIECPYAFDYIARDWKAILADGGFSSCVEDFFFHGYVRLLRAQR
ncbi:MAG: methyltransferase domain-containing protein [Candidatus Eisenbacteria sp.]|nr:methyltransferase domain-containing protein [Candidatus Eisenbacteria bacterium]